MSSEAPNLLVDRDVEHQPTRNIVVERIRGIHKDSSGKLWSIYLAEADEQDEEITELWKGEADSILVFTGLFSSVVATFLSISYSNLSLSPSVVTNGLLTQISQQLANNSNGVPSPNVTYMAPFAPSSSAIRVNVIWFLSLVLSIASALNATLFQQWSRRYLELTRRRVAPHKRARTRAYMFDGIASFKMSRAVKAMPIFLHLSIFLFFAGLVDFLWNTNYIVGCWILGSILAVTFAYLALTVLPNIYLNCPYSTPMSELSWQSFQRLHLFNLQLIQSLEGLLRGCLFSGRQRTYQAIQEPSWWSQWREAVKKGIETHKEWLDVGLQKSIMDSATDAPSDMDKGALAWTLTVLDDDREFEDFVARVPGFFDSDSISDAPSVILPLMDVQPDQSKHFDPLLGSRINDLLKTCVPGISPLTEQLRRNRLRVCMRTLWYFAREYNQHVDTTSLPPYVRIVFANPGMTRQIQSEKDPAAQLIGCSFSSLIVKRLVQDISSRTDPGPLPRDGELSCLAAILSKTPEEVFTLLNQPGGIGLANIVSLVSREIDTLVSGEVPLEVLDIFLKTLDILLEEDVWTSPNTELPPDLVAVFHGMSPLLRQRLLTTDLHVNTLRQILERLPMVGP